MHRILHQLVVAILSGSFIGQVYAEGSDIDIMFSWEGFRVTKYRSPTPEFAEGGQRIDTISLQDMNQQQPKPALIDVQPVRWQDGIFLQSKPRFNLPGSIWMPNVGLGELEPEWADYFSKGLRQASSGKMDYPLVIYCTADCWMSWNAVKRASVWGYTQVYWYAEGTDGWKEADLALEKATPLPFPVTLQPGN
ncbi:rhodanese-like domain-containing protein [Marinobacterium sediminicola]|uniref:PQQ-dependent catabolism-associated CXXCW motif protein n=1 Tax=Marinobacterium sediminicola TaxID=518898 RepID=A0ABY1RXL4_9GAMM|nr:rhodanese-like domain-containing protein [Marinobacterium sediminicola]ULG67734.1 hypothetical protein LN244_08340 [Marinobacterium sediminicola]SMR71623.1 PQQ-dependent catabolism-associated CXXCW motif protein [Marinobacterium sediminicola]